MSNRTVVRKLSDFVNARPEFPPPVPLGWNPRLGPDDPEDMVEVEPEREEDDFELEKELGWAAGQNFAIAYEDANGNETQRRITVRNLSLSFENVPILNAWCHERKGVRAFRLDRILEVITRDGEVIAPPYSFFVETFGMSLRLALCEAPKPVSLARIRRAFCHHLMVLAHMGRVDGEFIPDEQGIVLDHCLRLSRKRGLGATSAEEAALRRYLKTLKPTKAFLKRSFCALEREQPEDLDNMLIAANAVIDADGIRHPKEEEFFMDLRSELIGY